MALSPQPVHVDVVAGEAVAHIMVECGGARNRASSRLLTNLRVTRQLGGCKSHYSVVVLRTIDAEIQSLCGEGELRQDLGDSLSVVTINVWFAKHHQQRRYDALLDLLEEELPDIVAFQEVTLDFIGQLKERAWTAGYRWVDDHGAQLGHYGVGVLTRLSIGRAVYAELPSDQGRTVLCVDLEIGGKPFYVATTHLESMRPGKSRRAEQLSAIGTFLDRRGSGILCGDFNFCASWKTENAMLDGYLDVWSSLRAGEYGFTVDPTVNHMKPDNRPPVRFDRILLRGQAPFRAESIELFATECIPGLSAVWPSDHFGLKARMR